ncbi:hypothetical protein C8Q76DRAFT_735760 [Earliella scabrosa]|nr:hypothetical protein C8Q76DRAFT_735760 [Earliella scabrosa]
MAIFKANGLPSATPSSNLGPALSLRVRRVVSSVKFMSLPPRRRTTLAQSAPASTSPLRHPHAHKAHTSVPIAPFCDVDHLSLRTPVTLDPGSHPSPQPTISLLRLSFAQCRKDIRWRKEGFEMADSDAECIPFALRTHTLVPLDIAYARSDIRRRQEEYESRAVSLDVNPKQPRPPSTRISLLSTSLSCPTISNRSTLPSVYSHPSFRFSLDDDDLLDEADSIIEVYEVYHALPLHDLGYMSGSDNTAADLTSSSFDEDSFLRMAERSLDW